MKLPQTCASRCRANQRLANDCRRRGGRNGPLKTLSACTLGVEIFQSHSRKTILGSGEDEVDHLAVLAKPEALDDDANQNAFADHQKARIGAARRFGLVDDLCDRLPSDPIVQLGRRLSGQVRIHGHFGIPLASSRQLRVMAAAVVHEPTALLTHAAARQPLASHFCSSLSIDRA